MASSTGRRVVGNVVRFDESFAFREHHARWLYAGITRAAARLTVVR